MVCGQPWKLTQGKLLVFALRCVCFRLRLGLLRSFCYGPHAHETLVGVSTGLTRTRDFETNVRVHCCSVFVNLLYCKKLLTTVLRWTAHVSSDFVTFYSHLNHLNAFSDLVWEHARCPKVSWQLGALFLVGVDWIWLPSVEQLPYLCAILRVTISSIRMILRSRTELVHTCCWTIPYRFHVFLRFFAPSICYSMFIITLHNSAYMCYMVQQCSAMFSMLFVWPAISIGSTAMWEKKGKQFGF